MKLTTQLALKLFPAHTWQAMHMEWTMTRLRLMNALLPSRRQMADRVAGLSDVKLHLGCGRRVMDGWVNVDCFSAPGIDLIWDLRQPLPLKDGAAQLLYSEHVIEHLYFDEARGFLAECFRLLKPGGRFRLGMPDAEIYYRAYVEGKPEFFASLAHLGGSTEALDTPNRVINHMFRMGGHHFFAWDFETLKKELERAGFTGVEKSKSGHASIPELCLDDPAHEFETLYIEATK